ncbi:enoyl-CoA hydratase/carnithine racemase [Serpentinimonas maccroryi]|uniref:Enoyl-CoA hydratase/carnithine racemase n=1 Tax=Serpentinimonas maccroryi TaxID=1458426 RepID=A0A060NSC6_9BURK|nr:enoyl-CoA hydratase [Serpentinimonas maccroryi]BAO82423.1 enoyl-CoA hydratase/carnithine racemase [Serpentinimonas maccroryi]
MSDILNHLESGVQTLTLNRVARKNALTGAMYSQLAEVLEQAATDPAVRVLVLQGDATVFCAGNDLNDFLHSPPLGADSPVLRFLRAIASFPKPLLAAVCGPAVGIGTTLLLHCDLVYAGDNAAFSMPFVNLGLCAEGASSLLLAQLMGQQRAAEALLLGEPFYAEAALEAGLINKVLPPTEVNGYAQSVARKLAAKPQPSLLETKRLMKQGQQALVLQTIEQEAMVFGRMLREPAAKEAFGAFMQKRQPDFSRL